MIINSSFLIGDELKYVEEGHITIEDKRIVSVCEGFVTGGLDAKKYLTMPSLINAHTHIGDSFAKEAVVGMGVSEAVGKKGLKWKLYNEADDECIVRSMRESLRYMLHSGITAFADFREGGAKGINLLKSAVGNSLIKPIILGRDISTLKHQGSDTTGDGVECAGLGLNAYQLDQIPKNRGDKLIAVHAGETKREKNKKEIGNVLDYDPDIIVHFVSATADEINRVAEKNISIVICPRSNSSLRAGFPQVKEMLDSGINVALGTDNVMINSPNLFREMEFLSKFSYIMDPISPTDVLKMVTVNAASALNLNCGVIEPGRFADLIFLDMNAPNLKDNLDIIATIVHRCEPENVRKVMIDGKFIVDKDI